MDYLDELEILAERYGLAAIYAFGSRGEEIAARVCRDRSTPGSSDGSQADLDIGVQPAPDIHLGVDEKVLLALALEELFDVARVDLWSFRKWTLSWLSTSSAGNSSIAGTSMSKPSTNSMCSAVLPTWLAMNRSAGA